MVSVSMLLLASSLAATAASSASASPPAQAHAAKAAKLRFFYPVKLRNLSSNLNSTGVLTGIKQSKSGKISGKLILAPPLYGGGPFTGTVTGNKVKFTVASTPNNQCQCKTIAFTGSVGPKGTMTGSYIGTTKWGSENGTWKAAPHETFQCKIRSLASQKFVTTELSYEGAAYKNLLRARSTAVGSWQWYTCVAIGTDQWALRSRNNGKYVTVEASYPSSLKGLLRARATKVGKWEKFTFRAVPTCSCFALLASNSKFVTAELGNKGDTYGILRARSGRIGAWTKFNVTAT